MTQTTDSRPLTTTYSYTGARRPALAESGIFSTPTTALRPPASDLRTGTQFPVSSIQYQVPNTYNAANRLLSSSTNPSNPSDPLNQYFFDFRSPELGKWLSRDPLYERGSTTWFRFNRTNQIMIELRKLDLKLGSLEETAASASTRTIFPLINGTVFTTIPVVGGQTSQLGGSLVIGPSLPPFLGGSGSLTTTGITPICRYWK